MDLQLDLNPASSTFNDLLIVDGDLQLVSGQTEILQHIVQSLRIFLGEWFMDNTVGVPYFQQVFVKSPDVGNIDALIQDTINQVPGVTQLNTYASSVNAKTRQLFVTFTADTTEGVVNYSGLISGAANVTPTGTSTT